MNKLTNSIKKLLKSYLAEDFSRDASSKFGLDQQKFQTFVEEWINSQEGTKKMSKKTLTSKSRKLNGYQFFLRCNKGKGMSRDKLLEQWKQEDKEMWNKKAIEPIIYKEYSTDNRALIIDDVKIIQGYFDFAVIGNTKKFYEKFESYRHGKWNAYLKIDDKQTSGWIFRNKRLSDVITMIEER